MKIDSNTRISAELVITLIGIAFSAGILWMKIDSVDKRVARIEEKVFPVSLTESVNMTVASRR